MKKHLSALGSIQGVREASLVTMTGSTAVSSGDSPTLGDVAAGVTALLNQLQGVLPDLGDPLTVTLEGDHGALMLSKVGGKVLVLTTAPDANLGAVRLEMRDVLQDMATGEE